MRHCEEIVSAIAGLGIERPVRIMEVCGTHTMAIARNGIKSLLPEKVRLLSGPGCPVCVTPPEAIDSVLELAMNPDVIITTFGDMVRVPGSIPGDNLAGRRARGARVKIVYSPVDAVETAADNPQKEVVFLGVGFETTAPGIAAAVLSARERKIGNFSVFPMMKSVEPALRALIGQEDFNVQGLLCPGHVATVIGEKGFEFLPEEYSMPAVISGFECEDILNAVYMLLRQIADGTPKLENGYKRAVSFDGNVKAQEILKRVFLLRKDIWRGLGRIEDSGFAFREEFREYDAEHRFGVHRSDDAEQRMTACRCGDVITGKIAPQDCPLFGKRCVPEDPVGPCMVSGEGACAAAYKYMEA